MSDPPSRRKFLGAGVLAGAGAARALTAANVQPPLAHFTGLDDLGLPADVRVDVESFAQPVLRDVACLAELPLDGVNPAFVFVPRE